jgi:serine/threonine protein kinase
MVTHSVSSAPPGQVQKVDDRLRALQEVQLLRDLRHPNIVEYVESFMSCNGACLGIVMAYCEGGDLATHIKTQARLGALFQEDQVADW